MTALRPAIPQFSSPGLVDANGVPCGNAATGDNKRTVQLAFPAVSAYTPRMATYSTIALPTSPIDVDENAGKVTVQLQRTGDLSKRASVEVATVRSGDRPAAIGDFGAVLKRVAFDVGVDRLNVEVPIVDNTFIDSAVELRETPKQFSVVIRYASAAAIDNDETVVRILDDEPLPTATPSPTPVPGGDGGGGGALGHWVLLLLAAAGLWRAAGRWRRFPCDAGRCVWCAHPD